ncbi:rCG27004 [Rattus norvegicus]|uniref:RCG27004 n=1 Tax=Rattus norvegicus TaxID=10116 RepID=A6HNL5_RAT|nr:rCG27004 [Rattus norvegicus]
MRHANYYQSTHDSIKNKKNVLGHIMFRLQCFQ